MNWPQGIWLPGPITRHSLGPASPQLALVVFCYAWQVPETTRHFLLPAAVVRRPSHSTLPGSHPLPRAHIRHHFLSTPWWAGGGVDLHSSGEGFILCLRFLSLYQAGVKRPHQAWIENVIHLWHWPPLLQGQSLLLTLSPFVLHPSVPALVSFTLVPVMRCSFRTTRCDAWTQLPVPCLCIPGVNAGAHHQTT